MRDGTIDAATEIIGSWLSHDRILNELASGIAYDSGRDGLKWWLNGLVWLPENAGKSKALGIDSGRIQLVRNALSKEAFQAADWDHIKESLIGE